MEITLLQDQTRRSLGDMLLVEGYTIFYGAKLFLIGHRIRVSFVRSEDEGHNVDAVVDTRSARNAEI